MRLLIKWPFIVPAIGISVCESGENICDSNGLFFMRVINSGAPLHDSGVIVICCNL